MRKSLRYAMGFDLWSSVEWMCVLDGGVFCKIALSRGLVGKIIYRRNYQSSGDFQMELKLQNAEEWNFIRR